MRCGVGIGSGIAGDLRSLWIGQRIGEVGDRSAEILFSPGSIAFGNAAGGRKKFAQIGEFRTLPAPCRWGVAEIIFSIRSCFGACPIKRAWGWRQRLAAPLCLVSL
jgi:hypothetical protein